MTYPIKPLLAALSVAALTACGDSRYSTWEQEAGITPASFGLATRNNMLVQMCHSHIPKGTIVYEPQVVRAPAGSPAPYYYRVQCWGHLNGKYAEVIFREYVESATRPHPDAGGGLSRIAAAGGG